MEKPHPDDKSGLAIGGGFMTGPEIGFYTCEPRFSPLSAVCCPDWDSD